MEVLEDGLPLPVTILEWTDLEQAHAMYNSPPYQAALASLEGKVVRDSRILEGD